MRVRGAGLLLLLLLLFIFARFFVFEGKDNKNISHFRNLNHIGQIGWHFLDGSVVMLLDIGENPLVLFGDEVDSNSLTTETSTTSNSKMDRKKNREHVRGDKLNWLTKASTGRLSPQHTYL